MKRILVSIFLLLSSPAFAEDIWISQSGGTACSQSTQSAAWFNTAGNWGGGAGEIDPGDTVYFCGTITTDLTVQASGTSGNNIVFDGTNGTLNCKLIAGDTKDVSGTPRQYLTFQNITFASGRGGNSPCMNLGRSSNLTITNMVAQNTLGAYPLYLARASYVTADQVDLDGLNYWGISCFKADHITLSRLQIVTAANSSALQRDIIVSYGGNNITVEKSFIHNRHTGTQDGVSKNDIWETACSSGDAGCTSGDYPYGNIARYNLFILEKSGTINHNGLIWLSQSGTNEIHNNVFILKGTNYVTNILAMTQVGNNPTINIYNNTFFADSTYPTNFLNTQYSTSSTTVNLKNNIIYNSFSLGVAVLNPNGTTINRSNNVWKGFKTSGWAGGTCSSWIGSNSLCNSDPSLYAPSSNDCRIDESSLAYNTGVSLPGYATGLSTASSSFPDPTLVSRPQATLWDIGAYEVYGGGDITPPNIENQSPAPDVTGWLVTDRGVSFDVTDATGVDSSTLTFNIDGATNKTCTSGLTCTPSGDPTSLSVSYTRVTDWEWSTTYTINVSVDDTASPANSQATNWQFTTEANPDQGAPTLESGSEVPTPSSTIEVTSTGVSFNLEDDVAIDATTVQMDVGAATQTCGAGLTCSWIGPPGTPEQKIHAEYTHASNWNYGATYTVSIQADDTSANRLNDSWIFYTVTAPVPTAPSDIEIHIEKP